MSFRMKSCILWSGLAVVLGLTAGARCQSPTTEKQDSKSRVASTETDLWREGRRCGVNCVYIYLKANGLGVRFRELLESTPIGSKGSSIRDLCEGAKAVGYKLEAYKCPVRMLSVLKPPILVHMDQATGDVESTGHYVLVNGIDDKKGRVEVFDGGLAQAGTMSLEQFRRRWSGVVVRLAPATYPWPWLALLFIGGAGCLWRLGRRGYKGATCN